MNNKSQSEGEFSLLGCGCQSIVSVLGIIIVLPIIMPFHISGDAKKAKQSEAKQYVGSMNRAQQAKFSENGRFTNSIDALGIGIKTETTNYKYSINVANKAVFYYGLSKDKTLKSYVGAVFLAPSNKVGIDTVAILCIGKLSGRDKIAKPTHINGELACGDGTEEVTK